MRLIDADALKKLSSIVFTALDENGLVDPEWVDAETVAKQIAERILHYSLITNAPTVQREGWVSVEDSKYKTVIACLNKISEFCPIDNDVNQLDESPENLIKVSFAEIGDTARCAIAALIQAAPTKV